jgi:hypothetical protein
MEKKFPFTIRQVAEILNLQIRYDNPDNGNMDVDCPLCHKQSKMNLNAAKNVYRCNSCGAYGGMVQLYGQIHGVSNADAYREIYEIVGSAGANSVNSGATSSEESAAPTPPSRADGDTIHQTYKMLLTMLTLAAPHKERLLARGLTEDSIALFGYKSVPAFGQQGLCEKLLQSGCALEGVPGFYKDNGQWNAKLKAPGIIIPVCGIDGKIAGMQIRLDKPINGREYIWFSSAGLEGGASSGAPVHFIGDPAAKVIFVTDGSLKGAVAHALTRHTFVCLPGIKSLGGLDNLLQCLRANGAAEALEAFDIKKLTDDKLNESAAKLREKLSSYGFKTTSAVWNDKSLSGVDDYFLHRMQIKKGHVYSVVLAPPKPHPAAAPDFFPVRSVDISAAAFAV